MVFSCSVTCAARKTQEPTLQNFMEISKLLNLVNTNFAAADYRGARTALKKILDRYDENYEIHYRLAAAYALEGNQKDALKALSKAIDKGLWDVVLVRTDPALELLHDNPTFTALLERVAQAYKEFEPEIRQAARSSANVLAGTFESYDALMTAFKDALYELRYEDSFYYPKQYHKSRLGIVARFIPAFDLLADKAADSEAVYLKLLDFLAQEMEHDRFSGLFTSDLITRCSVFPIRYPASPSIPKALYLQGVAYAKNLSLMELEPSAMLRAETFRILQSALSHYPESEWAGLSLIKQIDLQEAESAKVALIDAIRLQYKNYPTVQEELWRVERERILQTYGAPAFVVKDTAGTEYTRESLKGKVIFIDFWASWSGPNREDMPTIAGLYKKYQKRGLVVIGVCVDEQETLGLQEFADFLKQYKMAWPQVFEGQGLKTSIVRAFHVESVPARFLFDTEGRYVSVGSSVKAMEDAIKRIIN